MLTQTFISSTVLKSFTIISAGLSLERTMSGLLWVLCVTEYLSTALFFDVFLSCPDVTHRRWPCVCLVCWPFVFLCRTSPCCLRKTGRFSWKEEWPSAVVKGPASAWLGTSCSASVSATHSQPFICILWRHDYRICHHVWSTRIECDNVINVKVETHWGCSFQPSCLILPLPLNYERWPHLIDGIHVIMWQEEP